MTRPNRIVTLAAILGLSGAALGTAGIASAQTRAQAPRPNAGEILSKSFQQSNNVGGDQVQGTPARNPLRAVVGGRGGRFIVDRDGRRRLPTRAVVSGSGVSVSGSSTRDDHAIRFHIGTGLGHGVVGRRLRRDHVHHTVFPSLGFHRFGSFGYGSYDTGRGYETPTVIIVENPPGAAVRTNEIDGPAYAEPVEPPTVTEVALAAMARGDHEDAIARWRERLAEAPDDAGAVRALGLSMALKGDMQTGAAMVAHAYQMSPELVHERLDLWALGGERELRRSLRRFVIYANDQKTESAWITVAALMQAENRDDHAARMVDKAREAGLEGELADRFKRALGAE